MHTCSLAMELEIPGTTSLKAKRSVVKHLVEGARARFHVASAEVGFHEQWQRTELGFACVASTAEHVDEVLSKVERFVWSHPEVVVLASRRAWVEPD